MRRSKSKSSMNATVPGRRMPVALLLQQCGPGQPFAGRARQGRSQLRRGSLSAQCSSRCAGSGISRRRWQISVRTDVFWDDACPRRSSFAGTGGGSGPDGVRSGHSGDGGRATRRGGQAGRPGQTAPLVEGLRARALEKMPGGCRFGRTASNRMDSAVRAGEEGGGADAQSDRSEGFKVARAA